MQPPLPPYQKSYGTLLILDILSCVERGRIAAGIILSGTLHGRTVHTERSTATA